MDHVHFSGFSARLFQFLSALAENNNREWFDEQRREPFDAGEVPRKPVGQRGGVRIETAPGNGTSVHVFLPRAQPRSLSKRQ